MLLENKYYKITDICNKELNAVFRIVFLSDCDVYRGHFPDNPVCPGVCNIQTIKECAMLLTGEKLLISTIKQCRLTAVASPVVCPEVNVTIGISLTDNGFTITATIVDTDRTYIEYKGDMIIDRTQQ
ncbi:MULTISPECIES: beta-hydroxyacyl-ACP dehydratase [Parabacteroides]|jgi:3-hydroxyacyl-[acyl-carrier-protein] dehydratase|uniref:beta-hydroxyacyl-ACP dehydratase n=1 Tax=Parabacteroides TaxID=375288 RepID=UPI000EFFAB06|nr:MULTISPECIES: beta-hydroxyacyl-ACP dehydratase [Parabacteroides]RHU30486.1 beta-hydroxyacyl-ACP dehydratase [Parabacteroides sp. TM07-1AC]WFE83814.1 beta-hydroxyacyl-ACP dehydratase [Parabacteroides chongii]